MVLLYLFVKNIKADILGLKYPFMNKSLKELDKTKPYLHYFSVLIILLIKYWSGKSGFLSHS